MHMLNDETEKISDNSLEKKQNGFSLIEAVVAIFILTIGLMGTAAALSYAIHYGTISRNVTNAKSIIVGQIEEIETLLKEIYVNTKQESMYVEIQRKDTVRIVFIQGETGNE